MYKIPSSITQDIEKFGTLAQGYQADKVSTTEFKAFRVPMGVYEQRKNEVYMARIRATGGVITPKQLLSIIDIATTNGSNLLHITTRGEIQILNLKLDNVQNVLNKLYEAHLATKGGGGNTIRNIIVSEFAGIDPDEPFDPTPYANALTSEMVAEADSYLMPRKMKIAFSGNPGFIDYAGVNDVGLISQIRDGKRGFKVYIGGGAGSKPTVGWLYKEFMPVEDLYALVKSLKTFFMAHGNRKDKYKARMRFIFYKLGKEETFRLIDKYFAEEKAKGTKVLDVDTTPVDDKEKATTILPFVWGNIHLDDAAKVEALKALLNKLAEFGEHTLRFTPKQNIRLRNIPLDQLDEVKKLIAAYTPDAALPAVLNNIVSCTGADTCRLGICLSKGLANAVFKALKNSQLDLELLADARINISGCPNLCGQPLWSDLGFVGKVLHTDHVYPAYQIYIGANYEDQPKLAETVGTVNAHDIPKFVVDLAARFTEYAELAEVFDRQLSFGKWLRSKAGRKAAEALVEKYSNVPLFADDKNYYFDWGSDDVFNVTKRGKPECSAGLFDMITVDKDSIADARDKDTYAVIFHAARMLLVTRGLDPQDAAGVFDAFIEHFIKTGYVDASFTELINAAKAGGESGTYDNAKANALADAVIALYESMDESLQFKKGPIQAHVKEGASTDEETNQNTVAKETDTKSEQTAEVATEPDGKSPFKGDLEGPSPTRTKDLRGVLCPMNFVRTKLELATLQSGDVLEILLDDGKPIENVPGSVRLEGHTVLSETQHTEGYWQVLIKKK